MPKIAIKICCLPRKRRLSVGFPSAKCWLSHWRVYEYVPRKEGSSVSPSTTAMKTAILCLLVASAFAAPSGKPRFHRGRNKIVGGTDVKPGEIPYQVSFQDTSFGYNFHFCGGSIYDETTIICAAHCVAGEDFDKPDYLRIVAGANDLTVEESTQQAIVLSKIIQHEDYASSTFTNDISLLKLTRSLSFDKYVQAIPLPDQMQDSTGDAVVSGWGALTEGGSSPDILQMVTVPIVSDDDCRTAYGESEIYDSMICSGEAGKDSCQGDSGGPMVCTSGGSSYLCGIVSWGYGCARPEYPGVYTEVSYFVDWVHANA